LQANQKVTSLNLGFNAIGVEGTKALSQMLQVTNNISSCPRCPFRSLNFHSAHVVTQNTTTEISLLDNWLQPAGCNLDKFVGMAVVLVAAESDRYFNDVVRMCCSGFWSDMHLEAFRK